MHNYLFGTPALPRKPSASGQSDWLILGAYPSALYVRWQPPAATPISAIAVADEPEPFWQGEDQESRIKAWADSLPWNPDWGMVSAPDYLNGSSGAWLSEHVLTPLGIARAHTWITDCLDIYHESDGAAKRLDDPSMRALIARLNIQDRDLPPHPSEGQIVTKAQVDRLRGELADCRPKCVITLGNAALRVFGSFVEGSAPIKRLVADSTYGERFDVRVLGGSLMELLPLAHPAAPEDYQQAHAKWRESRQRDA
jgi:hypothetical protein